MTLKPRSRVAAKFSGEPVRIHVCRAVRRHAPQCTRALRRSRPVPNPCKARSRAAPVRHAYGPHRDQWGDLLLPAIPAEEGPFPVCVLVHGGNWQAVHGADQMDALARDLQRRGWAAWNLEYRRVGPTSGGGWPQTGEDVLAGIDALADARRAARPRARRDRRLLVGRPARAVGGGRAPRRTDAPVRIRAAVAQAGAVHLARRGRARGRRVHGRDYDEDPERYAQASPAARLPLRVPTLLVHGEQDVVVPLVDEQALRRARPRGGRRA